MWYFPSIGITITLGSLEPINMHLSFLAAAAFFKSSNDTSASRVGLTVDFLAFLCFLKLAKKFTPLSSSYSNLFSNMFTPSRAVYLGASSLMPGSISLSNSSISWAPFFLSETYFGSSVSFSSLWKKIYSKATTWKSSIKIASSIWWLVNGMDASVNSYYVFNSCSKSINGAS